MKQQTTNPVYFNDRVMFTESDVYAWFEELLEAGEPIIIEFHGGNTTTKLYLDSVHEHFAKGHKKIPTGQYGEVVKVPESISFSDVLSYEVHIQNKQGKLKKVA